MPLRALGGTALVTVIAWGAYEWASSAGHGTIGMIAGILLVPAGLALAGLLAVTLTALARRAAAAIATRRRSGGELGGSGGGASATPGHEDGGGLGARRNRVAA